MANPEIENYVESMRQEPVLGLNALRDRALRIAEEHGFTEATVGEDIALMHSELSEALEDYRNGKQPDALWYTDSDGIAYNQKDPTRRLKPCGIPSEMADVIIRVLHFCGRRKIDIEQAVLEKMEYNHTRPFKNGGKLI